MNYYGTLLFILIAFSFPAFTQDLPPPIAISFDSLDDLGVVAKPTRQIITAQQALDFIMADKIVRASIIKAIGQGYNDWTAVAEKLGYDGDEAIWQVRVTSGSKIPPYTCLFRFDSIGNDRREQPWNGCQYE